MSIDWNKIIVTGLQAAGEELKNFLNSPAPNTAEQVNNVTDTPTVRLSKTRLYSVVECHAMHPGLVFISQPVYGEKLELPLADRGVRVVWV